MKKNNSPRFGLRFKFFMLVMAELIITAVLSGAVIWVLERVFHTTLNVSYLVRLLIFSIVIGSAATTYLSKVFLDPITKLGRAMNQVAEGDFHIQLESKSSFKEIQEIYSNFNVMAKELSATEILQTDFVSDVSHEFKTPINAIEGYASLLQDGQQTPEEQQKYIDKILFNTKRLSYLVGNILLLSKVNNQNIRLKPTKYRLDEQVRQAIMLLENKWTEKDIEFDVEMEEIEYCGYENLMLHVWTNLIDNAIKFNPQNGCIFMRMSLWGERIVFTIEDNGPGIGKEEQKHIYDKFYQSDSSHKEEGNGLGLALVKKIVGMSNGAIHVENIPLRGCQFTITLPAGI